MPKIREENWEIGDLSIPVHVYREWRKTQRISIVNQKVIIRLPVVGSDFNQIKFWAHQWIQDQFAKYPQLAEEFMPARYVNGQLIVTPRATYRIQINKKKRKTSTATLDNDVIHIQLPEEYDDLNSAQMIRRLISRVVSKHQYQWVNPRILELNARLIQGKIQSIRIKNNKTNWGSCSSKGNINISSRTLLAPLDVQDYVFIHELAHLRIMNHSTGFWELVGRCDPQYREKENWLKSNGTKLTF